MLMRSFSRFTMLFLFTILPLFWLNHVPATAEIVEEYEGVHLEIDLATNKLKVFLNTHELYTFNVATGKNRAETPLGAFKIVTKVKEPWYLPKQIAGGAPENPLGTRWLGLNVPGTNGYKYGIHGTNNPYSIGRHVTQGCIRLHNRDVEWLYQHIPKDTIVIIKHSSADQN
jgi:lipoprotein-anchoring transpeptidase ErfK/SrfK